MNAEDFGSRQLDLYDFGRQNKHLRIPGRNCLDPTHPAVYKHRMEIFAEVAREYDIDGVEFDFRRWHHMISNPRKNYPILTRMVAENRSRMADPKADAGIRLELGAMLLAFAERIDRPLPQVRPLGESKPPVFRGTRHCSVS